MKEFLETLMRKHIGGLVSRSSLVGHKTFFDPQIFSWVPLLEQNWRTIRQELEQVLQYQEALPNFEELVEYDADLTKDTQWKMFAFYAYGIKAEKNCDRCPETTRLIEQIPGLKTAFFSILLPHQRIPPHRGPYNGVLRYHLGLMVPEATDQCGIRVGKDIRHWQEGQSLVFDDSFEHTAWNDTDSVRVVLFLDVVRPVKFPISLLNQAVIQLFSWSPYIQGAAANQKKWDKRLDAVLAAKGTQ
ncbi:aspartyl/asparaginyl beta-hydroxylase domain-containing protein [Acaryochloris sp. CCMEE 5410]|uniref:aspartyl/asparaginyl beta-hydroxylase domain-containing protein n=1 Tax=Acaryochloris sp. CCMEE 5410 TaxID=310037 RepID=UPI0002483C67|nr:aspartyl/asparaginyl beta-hydroxylase domain-containing protein [Acaryochloris sp. CCMEE 5410]KAI9130690.1 aspartyl/asparaginyl beta-hydroxylase domain-containing protein [Acaryochloris sp. CCMEE 5410]